MNAQRWSARSAKDLNSSFDRLSSGLRINRASDDAAGLSIASGLRTDSRVYGQAIRNVNDGIGLLAVVEAAASQLTGIVTRIQELSQQAANGTLGSAQRAALDEEAQALSQEYSRIIATTEFNRLTLLDGANPTVLIQAGYGQNGGLELALPTLGSSGLVTVGSGDGTFTASVSLNMGSSTWGVAAGDFDGDGNMDLVSGANGGTASVRVSLGNGDGTFRANVSYSISANSVRMLDTGDINGDGKTDIIGGRDSDGKIFVLLGLGDGTFAAERSYFAAGFSAGTVQFHLADLDGTGGTDLVALNSTTGAVVTMLANSDGTYRAPVTLSSTAYSSAVGNFNGDSYQDIAVETATGVDIFMGTGGGGYAAAVSYTGATELSQSVDLNNDGKLDLIGASGSRIYTRLGNGDGTFRARVSTIIANATSMDMADFNDDGFLDAVINNYTTSRVEILLGNGNGTFLAGVSYATQPATQVTVTDLDNDDVMDLVVGAQGGTAFSVLLGNGTSTVTGSLTSGLESFSLLTRSAALVALDQMESSRETLTGQLGSIGAFVSRLDVAASNLIQARDGSTDAASRIMDVDVAEESSRLNRLAILQQSAQAVLAQANQLPEIVLKLLSE